MKHIAYCLIIVASITLSCASSNSVIKDDAYFSPYENNVTNNSELATSFDGNFSSSTIKSGTDYKYQDGIESSDSTSNTSVYIIDDSPKVSFGIGVGFGWPYYYGSFYYCWDPFYYPYFSYCWDPFYYPYYGYWWDPFYHPYYGYWWDPFWYGYGHIHYPHHPHYPPYHPNLAWNNNHSHYGPAHHGMGSVAGNRRMSGDRPNRIGSGGGNTSLGVSTRAGAERRTAAPAAGRNTRPQAIRPSGGTSRIEAAGRIPQSERIRPARPASNNGAERIQNNTQYNRPQRVSPSNNSQNSGAIRNSGSVNIRNNGGINHGSGIRNSGSTNVSRPSSGTVRSGGTNTVGGARIGGSSVGGSSIGSGSMRSNGGRR